MTERFNYGGRYHSREDAQLAMNGFYATGEIDASDNPKVIRKVIRLGGVPRDVYFIEIGPAGGERGA